MPDTTTDRGPWDVLGRPDDARTRARELGVTDAAEAFLRYYTDRVPLGGFYSAVLENDLRMAVGRADSRNAHRIPELVRWLWNYFPANAWGSPEKVRRHLEGEEVARG